MTPQPTSVTPASGTSAARVAAASAADAAVRRAEMVAASSSASGAPVRIEFRIITALARVAAGGDVAGERRDPLDTGHGVVTAVVTAQVG
nr:hypothetical protein GCM10020092_035170 [Actinoplanes digitatis]